MDLSLPREYGHFCPPESGVAPLASASNPRTFPVRVTTKELAKVEKYEDLNREIIRIWKSQERVIIPVVIVALGTIQPDFEQWTKKLNVNLNFYALQKACLLG